MTERGITAAVKERTRGTERTKQDERGNCGIKPRGEVKNAGVAGERVIKGSAQMERK